MASARRNRGLRLRSRVRTARSSFPVARRPLVLNEEGWRAELQVRVERVGLPFRILVSIANLVGWLILPHPASAVPALVWVVNALMWGRLASAAYLLWRRGGQALGRLATAACAADMLLVLAWVGATGGAASRFWPLLVVGVVMPLRLPGWRYVLLGGGFLAGSLVVTRGADVLLVLYLAATGTVLMPWIQRATALRLQVDVDALTGAFNHRYIQGRLAREIAGAAQHQDDVGFLYIDVDGFKLFNDTYGHQLGDVILRRVAAHLLRVCPPSGAVGRMGGDEFTMVLPRMSRTELPAVAEFVRAGIEAMDLRRDNGAPVALTVSVGLAAFPADGRTAHELVGAADASLYRAKNRGGNAVGAATETADRVGIAAGDPMLGALESLAVAVEHKDQNTAKHTDDVAQLSTRIAAALGVDERGAYQLRIGAILHDVGKIGVPDGILRKPGPLSSEEQRVMRRHAEIGYLMLKEIGGLREALDIVLHHHERYDGTGYPHGLRGSEIPLLTRIVTVADAFTAMTNDRPYRQRLAVAVALAELEKGSGSQFDPQVVEALLGVLAESGQQDPADSGMRAPDAVGRR